MRDHSFPTFVHIVTVFYLFIFFTLFGCSESDVFVISEGVDSFDTGLTVELLTHTTNAYFVRAKTK